MMKFIIIITTILLSVTINYTIQDLIFTVGCKATGSFCISPTQCCSGVCRGICISPCQPVNAPCNKSINNCCDGLTCNQATERCCRLVGKTALTPSECCSHQWKPYNIVRGGKCTHKCRRINETCDEQTNICCTGLQCGSSPTKCCRPAGQRALYQAECCSKYWIPDSVGNGGKCCSQHAEPCSDNTDCCSPLEHCKNTTWSYLCV
ncbi:unnamed protein product [Rotaria sp. Silwood1]|nr:unnamed protein product [Rotaria sp. Silwood1]CAF3334488.1 unnamed protein product [Rotaria sp. Silwood1]CAF3336094.1 unnamed protein product [Rotaria sp. Silwood1]CAF4552351.1 unnamed protein product [Rotaria sp. Silwood1]CAF4674510.1 unnamed protein product [Rotaria sp. Silwood1]